MKFLITENKLDNLIFKFLDDKFIIKETPNNYYFLENENDNTAIIRIRKGNMTWFVSNDLKKEIVSFFSMKSYKVEQLLKRYIEKTLNVELGFFDRFYTQITHPLKVSN